jgi:hypothetical protein
MKISSNWVRMILLLFIVIYMSEPRKVFFTCSTISSCYGASWSLDHVGGITLLDETGAWLKYEAATECTVQLNSNLTIS